MATNLTAAERNAARGILEKLQSIMARAEGAAEPASVAPDDLTPADVEMLEQHGISRARSAELRRKYGPTINESRAAADVPAELLAPDAAMLAEHGIDAKRARELATRYNLGSYLARMSRGER